MEHLLKLSSLTPDEIIHILDVADEYKRLHKAGADPTKPPPPTPRICRARPLP